MISTYLPPEDIWWFAKDNAARLAGEMVEVAKDLSTGNTLYLTCGEVYPELHVYDNAGKFLYSEYVSDPIDAESSFAWLCSEYLTDPLESGENQEPPEEPEEQEPYDEQQAIEDNMYEREDALRMALMDFLDVVLEGDAMEVDNIPEDMLSELLDGILEHLAEEGFDIYRPCYLVDEETGEEFYTSWPYETVPIPE